VGLNAQKRKACRSHKFFISHPWCAAAALLGPPLPAPSFLKPLISGGFAAFGASPAASFAMQQRLPGNLREKDFAGELFLEQYLIGEGGVRPASKKEGQMAWKAPKIVEVPVGMEINMYACAARK
jgi:coenzyme PQQ precursor peptide PqqA